MLKVLLNTSKILMKKKSFFILSIIVPAALTIVFSYMLGQESIYKVGIIDKDNSEISQLIKNKLDSINGIDIEEIEEAGSDSLLIGREVEIIVTIQENFQEDVLKEKENAIGIKSISETDVKEIVNLIIESESNNIYKISKLANGDINKFKELQDNYKNNMPEYKINDTNKAISVMRSVGIVIMMIFISGQIITKFILDDEENGTKNRILLSGISEKSYFAGIITVFYLCSSITSIVYYRICKMLNFDFEMENTIYFLIILLVVNLLAVTFNLCIVSFIKKPEVAANVGILIIIPTSMLSGAYWDFYLMPDYMQKIGYICPQRWAMAAIEKLQFGGKFIEIVPLILALILLSIVLFLLSIFFSKTRKKFA
ncbi:ABC transporter permease [Clostridium carnis]